jgi:hypothetical protein
MIPGSCRGLLAKKNSFSSSLGPNRQHRRASPPAALVANSAGAPGDEKHGGGLESNEEDERNL